MSLPSQCAPADADRTTEFQDRIRSAIAERVSLQIIGSGSKAFYGRPARGQPLVVSGHRGITAYEPTELVITARAGTPLDDLEAALAAQGQMLAFEPPHFGVGATLGGTVACGFSGPRRPYAGSVRDFVLGCRVLNGNAEVLRFGGQVMKNVAGFDVARLMAGALGTLGVLLEVSLKVLPRPRFEQTRCFDVTLEAAIEAMQAWSCRSWPISALAYDDRLRVRLSGDEAAVQAAGRRLGGEPSASGETYWHALREHRLPFFGGPTDLWRLSVAAASAPPRVPGEWLYDWGGAQRWLRSAATRADIFAAAADAGGHATLFRSARTIDRFQPLAPALHAVHRKLKLAFDPHGIFNVGRMYEDF